MSLPFQKLDYIFNPKSVAIVGASNTAGKMGYVYMKNILSGGWIGKIYPINPNEKEIQGHRAYASLKEAPEPIDLAIIVVPPKAVPSVMKDCAEGGVKAAVIITAGFKETGQVGAKLELEVAEISKKAGIRAVGPNCFGIYNCNTGLNASMGLGIPPRGGDISFATQSGAYGMAIFTCAMDMGLKFAKIMAYGNKVDVDDVDALQYFGNDPETKVVALFVESIDRGREFFEAAEKVVLKKPVVCTKIGRTAAAARASVSHTGALTGSYAIYETAFRQSGIIQARTGLELIDIIRAFDNQPLPEGNRVGILTNSGGTGIELTDLCQENELDVPELPADVQATIKPILLPFASAKNPVDITPDWTRFGELYYKCTAELLKCDEIDIAIPILLQRSAMSEEAVKGVRDATDEFQCRKNMKKPVIVCWVSIKDAEKNQKILDDAHIPYYAWPERTARVAGAMWRYSKYLRENGVKPK